MQRGDKLENANVKPEKEAGIEWNSRRKMRFSELGQNQIKSRIIKGVKHKV